MIPPMPSKTRKNPSTTLYPLQKKLPRNPRYPLESLSYKEHKMLSRISLRIKRFIARPKNKEQKRVEKYTKLLSQVEEKKSRLGSQEDKMARVLEKISANIRKELKNGQM
jgi:hypothetical protein